MDISQEEKQKIRDKIEKLKQSKFKQQTLPAWRPVPTAMSTMFTFTIFSVIFLAIGILLYIMSDQIVELSTRYDNNQTCMDNFRKKDGSGNTVACQIPFHTIDSEIKSPIFVYYQLDNFYQNHRRYVKSRDDSQLAGTYKTVSELSSNCDPIVKVSDLWYNQRFNKKNVKMPDDDPAIPCGLVAKSLFNDTYELWRNDANGNPTHKVDINPNNIAWTSDVTYKFHNIKDAPNGQSWEDVQWTDMTNRKFFFRNFNSVFRALHRLDENGRSAQLQKAVG